MFSGGASASGTDATEDVSVSLPVTSAAGTIVPDVVEFFTCIGG